VNVGSRGLKGYDFFQSTTYGNYNYARSDQGRKFSVMDIVARIGRGGMIEWDEATTSKPGDNNCSYRDVLCMKRSVKYEGIVFLEMNLSKEQSERLFRSLTSIKNS
jgi:hypothetical protein